MDFEKLPRFRKHQMKIMEMIPRWAEVYGVESKAIEQQIMPSHIWIDANPGRGPKKMVIRFLNTWMKNAHEWGTLKATDEIKTTGKSALDRQREFESSYQEDMTFDEMREIRLRNMGQKTVNGINMKGSIDTEAI